MADSAFDLKPSATALKPSVASAGNTAFDLQPTVTPPPKKNLAVLNAAIGDMAAQNQNKGFLRTAVDSAGDMLTGKANPLLQQVEDAYAFKPDDSTLTQVGKAGAKVILGIPSLALGAVDSITKQAAANAPVDGDSVLTTVKKAILNSPPALIGGAVKQLAIDPQTEQIAKGAAEYGQAIHGFQSSREQGKSLKEASDAATPYANSGVTRLGLGLMPVAGPMIAQTGDTIADTGKVLGPTLELAGNAALLGAGAQEGRLAKARSAAINDFVNADLVHATQNGVAFDRKASLAKANALPTQDLIDTTQAVNEQIGKNNAVAGAKSRMAQAVPEVEPTDSIPVENAPPVIQSKLNAETTPAVPASDLAAAQKQAAKVQPQIAPQEGAPTEGSPAPALISDEERAHLEQKGFTVDDQGRLARLVQPRDVNPAAGQAALEGIPPPSTQETITPAVTPSDAGLLREGVPQKFPTVEPTTAAPTDPALLAELDKRGYGVDTQGKLVPKESLRVGQDNPALDAEVDRLKTVRGGSLPNEPIITPAPVERMALPEKVATNVVPGNNPTPEDIAALKAKNGIVDVPGDKVGAGQGQGLKTNLLKNRSRTGETGAVRLDALTAAPAEGVAKVAKAVGEAASEGRGIASAIGSEQKTSTGELPKYAGSINLEKLATGDDVKRAVLDSYTANKKVVDKVRAPGTTFEQTKKAALDLGWNEKDVIKAQKKGALDSAQIQAARQATLAANEDVAKANKAYTADPSTTNLIARAEALSRSATINQAMQGASAEAGRALNAHKILAEALRQSQTDSQKAMEVIRKQLGDKWEQTQDAVTRAIAALPEGDTASLNKLIRSYSKFTTPNKVFAYYNANLLSGIQTNVKNHFLSRVVSSGMEDATRTVAGLLDPALSKIQGRPREFYAREGAYSLLARMDGVQEGAQNAIQILKHGVTESKAQDLGRSRRFEFTGWAAPFNIPGRLAEASVALFKSMSVSGELKALSVRQGLKEGLRGKALDTRMNELLANPADEMIKQATITADRINFTTAPGSWTQAFINFRNSVPPMKFVTPFVNIPMNIMKAGVEFSPAGYLKMPREMAMGMFGKMTGDTVGAERLNYWKSPEAADAFARASIGTAVAIYAASKYENGELTGKAPSSSSEKDQFLRQHPEYSVKVNGRWLKYTDFGPLMVPFMTAAAIKDAQQTKSSEGADAVAYQAIGTLANGALQQSFYKGMNDMASVFGGNVDSFKGSVIRTGAGYASGFIPGSGLLHSTKNIVDPTLRDPDGIYERIKSGIPWLSNTVPSKLNALGNETQGSPISGILGMGFKSAKIPELDIEKELARTGVSPSLQSKNLSIDSSQFELTRDQKRELTDLNGQARKQMLRSLFSDQDQVTLGQGSDRETLSYSQMTDEQKAKAIRRTIEDADKAARDEFVNRINARNEAVKQKPKKALLQFVGQD